MLPYVYQGAIGRKIILNVEVDISSATIRQIKYKKPDGTSGHWDATEESPKSISYVTVSKSDLGVSGIWILWADIVTPTWSDRGDVDRLLVKPSE